MYPLLVATKSQSQARRSAAYSVLDAIRQHAAALVEQAQLVSGELIRMAILWHEMWHEGACPRAWGAQRTEAWKGGRWQGQIWQQWASATCPPATQRITTAASACLSLVGCAHPFHTQSCSARFA